MNTHELLGRAIAERVQAQEAYGKAYMMLKKLKEGDAKLDDLIVDDKGFRLKSEEKDE